MINKELKYSVFLQFKANVFRNDFHTVMKPFSKDGLLWVNLVSPGCMEVAFKTPDKRDSFADTIEKELDKHNMIKKRKI